MTVVMSNSRADSPQARVILCDLDGVVWLAHQPIAGSVAAIASLRGAGHRVLFVTNNSADTVETQEEALDKIGIPAGGDVLTSAMAAARLVSSDERVLVCGGDGIRQAVTLRGATVVDDGQADARADAVIVGFHRNFDYAGLCRAARAVHLGARLIGTNDDATYPTADGPIPGGGSILAAVETAAGCRAIVAGKPHRPMAELVVETVGSVRARQALMVGDRASTDGKFARLLKCSYGHVWSGVTSPDDDLGLVPDLVGDNLAAIAAGVLSGGRPVGFA